MTDRDKEAKSIIEKDALIKVQMLARRLRNQNSKDDHNIDYTIPIGYEERVGHLNNRPVKRIIIYLRSTGCEWVKKTGGCTMCGFYGVTAHGKEISEGEYISQFKNILNKIDLNDYPIVCIYNDGNILNENELPITALEKIFKMINQYKKVKKVVIESRIEYATEERVRSIVKSIDGKKLEIAFGFETSNQEIMKLCINKGFSLSNFNHFYPYLHQSGVSIRPLLLLKPPFLTEGEAIADVLSTVDYLFERGINDMDLEVTTVQRNTVVQQLWMNNLYRPPWLWSIVDILLQFKNKYQDRLHLYISPWEYSIESVDKVRNCGKCDKNVKECIDRYNNDFDTTVFKDLECLCKNKWRDAIEEINDLTIPERIINQLETITTN